MNDAAASARKPIAPVRASGSSRRGAMHSSHAASDPNIALVRQAVFARDPEFQAYGEGCCHALWAGTVDYLFVGAQDDPTPDDLFDRLRWGGQMIYVSTDASQLSRIASRFASSGFVVDTPPASIWRGMRLWRWGVPGFGRRIHYFVARKVHMVQPGQYSDRFTYSVCLERGDADGERYVVVKRVPTFESLVERLTQKFPDQPHKLIADRARKMSQTIFPVFLTREAAFLKILQRDLPEEDRPRVPRVLEIEKDERGMVRMLKLNWLRKAHQPLSQLDFAIQSTQLLKHLHQRAQIIHLDLRLDNFVISRHGVGFVDYGSAVRVDEKIADSPLLNQLFTEIMRTSQIQRMLEKMSNDGSVTSEVITQSSRQADPAVDLFYLAVQIDKPHSNPYMAELVRYEPHSREARLISQLVEQVLRPADASNPKYRSAADMLAGLYEIRQTLRDEGESH